MFREFERAGHTRTPFYEVSGSISDGTLMNLSDGYRYRYVRLMIHLWSSRVAAAWTHE